MSAGLRLFRVGGLRFSRRTALSALTAAPNVVEPSRSSDLSASMKSGWKVICPRGTRIRVDKRRRIRRRSRSPFPEAPGRRRHGERGVSARMNTSRRKRRFVAKSIAKCTSRGVGSPFRRFGRSLHR